MSTANATAFGRTGVFWLFIKAMDDYYGGCIKKVNLPVSLFNDHMRLMPLTEMTRFFGILEEGISDELFIAKGCSKMQLKNFAPLDSIVCSSPVFFTALMRFNSLFKCLQSGCDARTVRSGGIFKWCYRTELTVSEERLQDGIVGAWTFIHLLRLYHDQSYAPIAVHLPGSCLGEPGEMQQILGCDVIWNAKQTEVWFSAGSMSKLAPEKTKFRPKVRINQMDILSYINIPAADDFVRCVYELINYARAFGYPKLEFIAEILMISPLTLQRRLQKENTSFSDLVKYQLLYNLAPQMLAKGELSEQISKELGFSNPQSFSKAFKKAHDVTPKQFVEHTDMFKGLCD
ncbi:AraC family transcriptional regulator [Psychromonas aquimarina]|uniref:AraC family transcriptional regulator n=1 Tax=Psychromonas aquimarina TaxID=444919 RepID=UPI00041CF997|nr:AraC family transcriptional regulator [Psychromonas aquimarina]